MLYNMDHVQRGSQLSHLEVSLSLIIKQAHNTMHCVMASVVMASVVIASVAMASAV